ncbi:initiator tRNA phosphoribosyl transferase [Earliella scabrosa]|nr:initiator tRNA phosphoribosyl transferase [Earliella scabrosa]
MSFDFDVKKANAEALEYVRKESLDIYNRLHSILEDVRFVGQVHDAYPELPILPNLRCGAWYVDPAIATHEPAYFKSTDGHFGNWSFNLRRPNLHLLPLIIARQGLVLVDSTRAGKRIPDALSKTVPIWCAVVNRAMALLHPEKGEGWDIEVYCPPGAVSEQERSQMKMRLDKWAKALAESSYSLPNLPRPLRPIWITPATSVFPRLPNGDSARYIPVVCVSASKQVSEGVERRTHGFSYVQGSGDDHELWGMGLNPQLFWQHKQTLIDTDREDLPLIVDNLVVRSKVCARRDFWKALPTPIAAVSGRLLIGSVPDMPSELPSELLNVCGPVSFVVISAIVPCPDESAAADGDEEDSSEVQHVFRLRLAEGKKDQIHFLQHVLPEATRYIKARLAERHTVCVCCDSGRDASVGVALAALQLFFDEKGEPVVERQAAVPASKESIRTRLQWIIASRPAANPSRATLKRVNEFLLSSPSFRRH